MAKVGIGSGASAAGGPARLRATQTLISHMGFVWRHPSLTLMEVAWRWLVGIPFLLLAWGQAQRILVQIPPSSVGWDRINLQNPWLSSVLLAEAIGKYQPAVVEVLRWLAPAAVLVWAVVSGVGRVLILWRMEVLDCGPQLRPGKMGRGLGRKLPGVIMLQALWMLALLACFWLWYEGVGWAAARDITSGAQPDLVAYLCWLIFLSLGFFVFWAMTSWTLAVAPLLYVLEDCSVAAALGRSVSAGREFSSKLAEVNLVMAIVKIALIVLAMVFSAAPLPFSDEFGPDFLHVLYVVIAIAFLIGNDYFHVVRLRSFVALRRVYRGTRGRLWPEQSVFTSPL